MFFVKKELFRNWYIVILGMLVTAFVFSVSMVLFSLSSSIKDNHIDELNRSYPDGIQIQLSKNNFNKFSQIEYSDAYQFVIFTGNSISFNIGMTTKKSHYIEQIDENFFYHQYNGLFVQSTQALPSFIQNQFTFFEKTTDSLNETNIYPIYFSQDFADYLGVEINDQISLRFLDGNDNLLNPTDYVSLKVSGIYQTDTPQYQYIHYVVTIPEMSSLYTSYSTIFNTGIVINDMSEIYHIHDQLEIRGIQFTGIFGFADYLKMNQNMSVIFLILSMIILVIGTFLLLNITFLIIKNRMEWITMVKSLGLSSIKIVFVYVFIMQFILLIACSISVGLVYVMNNRIEHLAELILEFRFINTFNLMHFLSVYAIAFVFLCLLSLFIYTYIRKHSVNELITVRV